MKYCKPNKHEYKLAWHNGNIVWQCQNCPCKKYNHAATKRYNDNVELFGTESANRMSGF